MHKCRDCHETKNLVNFKKNSRVKQGFLNTCYACLAKKERERRKKKGQEDADKQKLLKDNSSLFYKYGITIQTYKKMEKAQQGVCAICAKTEIRKDRERLSVDHCHSTGKVRGLLCSKCNAGVGQFNDDPELLKKATLYLAY